MRDVMVDIETLGTRPGSVIASVGAIEFDAITGEFGREFFAAIDIETAQAVDLSIDAATVKWWMQQSPDAISKTFSGTQSLTFALIDLRSFIVTIDPERVWAHSPSFDLVQLDWAYQKVSVDAPWSYRQTKDTRTLFDLAGVKIQSSGTQHDALDDAKVQAAAVLEAYRVFGFSRPPSPV